MAFGFRKSIKLIPGVRLNIGKRGVGISAGVRGLHVGMNSQGKRYASAGIPGTGVSVRKFAGTAKTAAPEKQQSIAAPTKLHIAAPTPQNTPDTVQSVSFGARVAAVVIVGLFCLAAAIAVFAFLR